MRLVTEVRRFRSDQGLRPGQRVPRVLAGIEATPLAGHEDQIRSLLRLDRARATASRPPRRWPPRASPWSSTWPARSTSAAERRRLEKDLAAARKEAEQAERKLANAAFPAKAPGEWWPRPASASRRPDPTSPASAGALADLAVITARYGQFPGHERRPCAR